MVLYYIYLLPLIASVIASLSTLRLDWPASFRHFGIFLAVTLAIEVSATLWSYGLHTAGWWDYSPNNIWLYNLYIIPQYLFYIYFFARNITFRWIRKMGLVIAGLYLSLAIQNLFIARTLFVVNSLTIIVADFIVIFFTTTYFIQLMRATTVVRLARQPLFWIAAGAFLFHLGNLPCFMLYRYISAEDPVLASSLFRIIVMLNCVMYVLYSIAFLCTKKFPTSPS